MSLKKIVFLILIFFAGIIFYCFYNNLIIIRFPSKLNLEIKHKYSHNKSSKFFFYQDDKYITDQKDIITSENILENINNILITWLSINYEFEKEDKKSSKQITIQEVMIDPENFAYISFDKNPLNKQSSIYQKIKFIESILKTLKENKIKIQGVYFLVNHKFLEDSHLDFSHSWPITGYSEIN